MLELRVKAGRRVLPIFDLPAALGRREAAREIGDQIDALIAFMDDLSGDPDLEADMSDFEPDDDGGRGDVSWTEWHTRGRHKTDQFGSEARAGQPGRYYLQEDDEDDDPTEANGDERDANGSEEDFMVHTLLGSGGIGCPVSDPGEAEDGF